jgi:hypothetical protein
VFVGGEGITKMIDAVALSIIIESIVWGLCYDVLIHPGYTHVLLFLDWEQQ